MGIEANSSVPTYLSFVIKSLKNLSCALCLNDFYFHRKVCKQKSVWGNLTVSQYLGLSSKWVPKKNFAKNFSCYSKVTVVVQNSNFRGMLTVIFRGINCNEGIANHKLFVL